MDNNIMDWGDVIESDGQEHKVLPEGDYDFTITKFERGRFPGSPKIPPCNKAILTLSVNGITIKTDLILYKTLEWKLAAFFRSIGMPGNLTELGVRPTEEDIRALALDATMNDTLRLSRIRPLDAQAVAEIYRNAR